MTVQALRNRIGERRPASRVFKKWNKKNEYANGSIKKFRKLAEKVSGEDLAGLLQALAVRHASKPAATAENGLEDVGGITAADIAGLGRADRQEDQIAEFERSARLTTARRRPAPLLTGSGAGPASDAALRDHRRRRIESRENFLRPRPNSLARCGHREV